MLRVFRSIWPINIRTQMMLWYTLIFAILIFLFGAVFYINLQTSLETNIDAELQQHAQEIANGINDDKGTITVEDVHLEQIRALVAAGGATRLCLREA